jgi:electron transfer flavoprotein alpha subunit
MSVLVYTENWDGKFKKLSFELVSYAAKLAEMLNTKAIALSIGELTNDELGKLATYGAGEILSLSDKNLTVHDSRVYTRLIASAVEETGATVVVMAHNNVGKALAPRLSVRLKAGLGSSVCKLPSSTEPFTIHKKVFSGNAYANVVINTPVRIITLSQNTFGIIEAPQPVNIREWSPSYEAGLLSMNLKDVQKQSGKILLTDADIVVSGGRGMKGAENWGPIEELAGILGAATACSRPVSDEGWRSHEEHTGQTGKVIAPNLYFAFGISGAIQHLAGVSSSKVIVAVNKDPDAPIFGAATYGILGDVQQVLPELVAAVKEIRQG